MAKIVLDHVSKVFGADVVAVNDVTLEIRDGEISIGDRQVTDLPPKDRDIAMVFQNYALYPHMTVEQNLGFGLKLRKTAKPEIKRRVNEAARILGLEELLKRKPAALSGGQ